MKIGIPDGPGPGPKREIDVNRAVVKLGTKQITDLESVNTANVRGLVGEIVALRGKGVEFVLAASGAIGLGVHHLYGRASAVRELTLSQKQAVAGYGQVYLMELFQKEFAAHGISVGQVLLTYDIFENRGTYLNARNTLNAMLGLGIVPVINENDSVAVEEIKFGDNDRLGAYVSLLVDSDLYVMLSDVDGMYKNYGAKGQELIRLVDDLPSVREHAGAQEESYTRGGMVTKLQAARITMQSGVPSVLANGFKKGVLTRIFDGQPEGTVFLPGKKGLNYRKRWITGRKPKGRLVVDDGAAAAVCRHKSLLPSGIITVEGGFKSGDTVLIVDRRGGEIALGLSNYSSDEAAQIAGRKSAEINGVLGGDSHDPSVVHIDNMVVYEG